MNKKYSDWLRVDLHIHTDKSKQTKENDYQGNFSVDTLHTKLTENNVKIFSLTDHNIINVEPYREYYSNYNRDEDPLLLVGVELDIEVPSDSGSDAKLYHSLLIFDYHSGDKAEEINNKLNDKYTEKGLDDKNRKLTLEEIVELFHNDDFFFIPHAHGHRNIVSAYENVGIGEAQKMVLLMHSALEKVTKEEKRRIYNSGFSRLLTDSFRTRDDIPYIEFSDNHNIEQYPKRHKGGEGQSNHEFYYIKGSKNYETIRLAFIDPRSRIKSQKEYDQIDSISNKIEKIKIENEPKIDDVELYFSPHLNVIIGGRSSGKSLLMNVLGKKIDKVNIASHYNITDENFLVKSKDDDDYKIKTSVNVEVLYINQGDIVRYFEHKDLRSLAKDTHKSDEYEQALGKIKEKKENLQHKIADLVDAYGDLVDIGNEVKYELHQSTIHHIFSEEYILVLEEIKIKEEFINTEKIEEAQKLVEDLIQNTEEFKSNEIFEFTDDEKTTIDSFLTILEGKQNLIKEKNSKDLQKSNFLKKVKDCIDTINGTLSQGAQQKSGAKDKLENLKNDIKTKFKRASALKKYSEIVESYNYATEESLDLSDDVSLVLSVKQKENHSLKDIILSDVISQSQASKSIFLNLLDLYNESQRIKNLGGNTKDNFHKKLNTVLKSIYEKFDKPIDYLRYSDGSTSEDNSPGLNSEKYLEVVLKNNTIKMVFIDQPEDNLGNKFISDTLVDIIREIKFQKQVFLVTHNPAIAVYGDAECIIIAENTDKIRYKQITLEDKDAQKEICEVLDGGEYIFDNRSKKYNIQKLLRRS